MKYINWLYFAQSTYQKNKVIYFLYGLTVSTKYEENIYKKYTRKLPGRKDKLVCFEFTSCNALYCENKIDFSQMNEIEEFKEYTEFLKNIEVLYSKKTIQVSREVYENIAPSFLSLPVSMTTHSSDSFNRYYENIIINKEKDSFLFDVIELLEKESKQPFKSTYSSRIGTYEIAQVKEWVEDLSDPCYIETKLNKEKTKRPYMLKKHKSFFDKSFTIHLIIFNDYNEVIYDEISTIKENEEELFLCEFDLNEDSSIEYWIFDDTNKLICREKNLYINSISLNMGVIGDSYNFPANTFSKGGQLSKDDHSVSTVRYSHSNIQTKKESSHNTSFLTNLINKHYKKDSKDSGYFFTKKENTFNELKSFFNEITQIDGYEVFIIDPFISSNSLEYFRLLTNANISICLISCWDNSISPDGEMNTIIVKSIEQTQLHLDSLKDYNLPVSHTKWFNLKPDKFHDRYIYLVNKKSSKTKIFTISNSLNNLLTNYENLLILPLKESVKTDAENYIKSLINLCVDVNRVYPRINK